MNSNINARSQLANEHYDLIEKFLRSKGVREDDDLAYDAAVDGFMSAIDVYTTNEAVAANHDFRAVAYQRMTFKLMDSNKKEKRRKEIAPTYSLDNTIGERGTYHEIIGGRGASVEDTVERRTTIADALKGCTDKQLRAVFLCAKGFTSPETGKIFGISAGGVRSRLYRARRTAREVASDMMATT